MQGMEAGHDEVARGPQVAEGNRDRQMQLRMLLEELFVLLVEFLDFLAHFARCSGGQAFLELQLGEQLPAL